MNKKSLAERVGYTTGVECLEDEEGYGLSKCVLEVSWDDNASAWATIRKKEDCRLYAAAHKTLEALVRECLKRISDGEESLIGDYSLKAIESATGMTWDQLNQPPK